MSSYQFELSLRQYIAAFDGTNNLSPDVFMSLFDNIDPKDVTHFPIYEDERVIGDGPVTREEIFQLYSKLSASGLKMTLVHFRKIGGDCVDIKLRLEDSNGKEMKTIRVVHSYYSAPRYILKQEVPSSPSTIPVSVPM